MSNTRARLRNALFGLFKSFGFEADAFSAEVIGVDLDTRSCSVISLSSEVEVQYDNVWLMPEIQDGMLYVPKVGSTVIVQNNNQLQPYVVMWSAIDEVLYVVNKTTFKVTDGLTTFNKGENDGLVNVKPLVEKINALEKLLNDVVIKFNAHTHATTCPAGGGTAAPTPTPEPDSIAPLTQQSDLEDTKVKH